MDNVVSAILFALNYLDVHVEPHNMVIMDRFHSLYSTEFPQAKFLSPFAGESAKWTKAGHAPLPSGDMAKIILVHAPQQSTEADFMIATALSMADSNGLVMVVADNQAGGKTLTKRMAGFGCPVQDLSKQKCRVTWTQSPHKADKDMISNALSKGSVQPRADGTQTQPGVFSWGSIDSGTQILLRHLPQTLSGKGADFGCGVGDISHFILQHNPDISELTCIDHDHRSVDCCTKNLSDFAQKVSCVWQDIPTQTNIKGLDFIVMNPPFHAGKTEDKDLGKAFITKAAHALKPKGILYMVANAHLPYDGLLQSLFGSVEMIAKENGFKIFVATR